MIALTFIISCHIFFFLFILATAVDAAPVDVADFMKNDTIEKLLAIQTNDSKVKKDVEKAWRIIEGFSTDYNSTTTNSLVVEIINALHGKTNLWIDYFIDHFKLLTEKDLKNKYYIHLLQEFKKAEIFGSYKKCEIDEIILHLEQIYTDIIWGTGWWDRILWWFNTQAF